MKKLYVLIGLFILMVTSLYAGQVEVYHNNRYISKVNISLNTDPGSQLLIETSFKDGLFKCIISLKGGNGVKKYVSEYFIIGIYVNHYYTPYDTTSPLGEQVRVPLNGTPGKIIISSSDTSINSDTAAFILDFDIYGNIISVK